MSLSVCLPHEVSEPLQCQIDLPFQRTYHPYGFRLNLASNSHEVLHAAEENWGMYEGQYHDPPLTVRVIVQPGSEFSPPPVHGSQDHLYSLVGSRRN